MPTSQEESSETAASLALVVQKMAERSVVPEPAASLCERTPIVTIALIAVGNLKVRGAPFIINLPTTSGSSSRTLLFGCDTAEQKPLGRIGT